MFGSGRYSRKHSHSSTSVTKSVTIFLLQAACILLLSSGNHGSMLRTADCRFVSAFSVNAPVPTRERGTIPSVAATGRCSGTMLACNCNCNDSGNDSGNNHREPDRQTREDPETQHHRFDPHRRKWFRDTLVTGATTLAAAATASAAPPAANANAASGPKKSRTDGYAVQHTEREWAYILSGAQYNILRRGGTERQRSSILHTFSAAGNPGTYLCAGCRTPLFASADKFDSRTGWPSFSAALQPEGSGGNGGGVELEELDPIRATLDGREVRCGTCGGHLGDLFNDGWVYPGTSAFATGKRYCIDGAALVFRPAATNANANAEQGEANTINEDDLVYGDQPPPNKAIQYQPSLYRDAA